MEDAPLLVDDRDRYARLRLIPWWDPDRVRGARVLVAGAGALGSEVLKNLALVGVGGIWVVDLDAVDASNLSRSMLYRAADVGRPKAEAAAEALEALNPDVRVRALRGDLADVLGIGVVGEMDIVIGCLDSREARLRLNRLCWKAGRPWIDGALQELRGVCKVFRPPDGACFECGLTEQDQRLLNLRTSCPLLREEDRIQGRIPTTPTAAAIVAGIQVQEALKLLHGLPVRTGVAHVYNGEAPGLYTTAYSRREDCPAHETYPAAVDLPLGRAATAAAMLAAAGGTALRLDRDLVEAFECAGCGSEEMVGRPASGVRRGEARCPRCGEERRPRLVQRIGTADPLVGRSLEALGIPAYDVLRVETPGGRSWVRLSADRETALGGSGRP